MGFILSFKGSRCRAGRIRAVFKELQLQLEWTLGLAKVSVLPVHVLQEEDHTKQETLVHLCVLPLTQELNLRAAGQPVVEVLAALQMSQDSQALVAGSSHTKEQRHVAQTSLASHGCRFQPRQMSY